MNQSNDKSIYQIPTLAIPTIALVAGILIAWSWGILGYATGGLPLGISFLMNLVAAHMAFTGLHDASHYSLGKKRWISVVAGELLCVILFANFQIFRQIHQRHHRHTNDDHEDPDAWLGVGPAWQLPLRWLAVDYHYLREFRPSQLKIGGFEKFAMVASAIATILLLSILFHTGNALAIGLLWFLPARISLVAAAYYADYVPHQRPHAIPRKKHRFLHTANIRGRWLGLLLMGHNMHLVHHLYPGVPFYRCFKIWRLRRDEWLAAGAKEVPLTRPSGNLDLVTPTKPTAPVVTPSGCG